MKKNILLPTDFSDNSWSAIVYAIKLFAKDSCTFYLTHSWSFSNSTSRTFITSHYIDQLKEEAYKQLIELKEQAEITNTSKNIDFQIVFSDKPLLDVVENTIKKHEINLVVMGTKGATKTKEFFFGSNTVRIIKAIKKCPILIVPDEFDFVEPKQIAFPTDFSRSYESKELNPLLHLAELYNSKIRILHINEEDKLSHLQESNLEKLKSYFKNYVHSFHWMPDYAKKTQEINDFIEELDINILVMIHYEHSIFESIIKEPIIKKIGFKPMIPVLIIPDVT